MIWRSPTIFTFYEAPIPMTCLRFTSDADSTSVIDLLTRSTIATLQGEIVTPTQGRQLSTNEASGINAHLARLRGEVNLDVWDDDLIAN